MLSTRRRIPQAERSLNSLALSVLADLASISPPSRGHTGYRVGWAMATLEDDSKRVVNYHIENLKKEHGENWGEVLHTKVKELISKLNYWLDDQQE